METKRQRIVTKILEAVQGISTASGYETDIGANCDDWRTNWQEDELPGTSVCDQTAEYIENLSEDHIDYFRLPVQIRTSISSGTRAAEARKIEADILKALRPLAGGIADADGKIASDIQVRRSGFVLAEDAFTVVAVAVEVEVTFYTERFNAYQ